MEGSAGRLKGKAGGKTIHNVGIESCAGTLGTSISDAKDIVAEQGAHALKCKAGNKAGVEAAQLAWAEAASTDQSGWLLKHARIRTTNYRGRTGSVTSISKGGSLKIRLDGSNETDYRPCVSHKNVQAV